MSVPRTSRSNVYAAIDTERTYQVQRWHPPGESTGDAEHELDAWLLYILDYAQRAVREGSSQPNENPTSVLDVVRKVAGLCVACMEQHGAPRRIEPAMWARGGLENPPRGT